MEHDPGRIDDATVTLPLLSRRSSLRMLMLGAVSLTAAACGARAPSEIFAPVSAPTPTSGAVAGAPKRGGVLRQGYSADVTGLDPQLRVGNDVVWLGVFDRLTAYDEKLQPTPLLAESWEFNADASQLKLNLRKGVTFHSGREFTSDDVKYTIQRTANPKVAAAQYTGMASWFSDVETPDKYTAILKADSPHPTAFDLLEFLNIGDKDTLEGPNAKTTAVGTGPFSLAEWVPGDHVTLMKNPNYWQSGKPYLDQVVVAIYRDQLAMVTALEAGAIHVARAPSLADFNRLKTDSTWHAEVNPYTGSHYVAGFNLTKPPFENKQVRQALNYAIDRERFVKTILGGLGRAESLPWLTASPAYESAKQDRYAFDLEKARSLLDSAGINNLEFDYVVTSSIETNGFGQIVQADYQKIGVKMNLLSYDSATWVDQVNNRKFNGLYFSTAPYFNLSPSTAFTNGKGFNPQLNNSAFTSETYVQLINAAAAETDPSKQKAIYSQLNDLMLDESFVLFVSASPASSLLAASSVQGIEWTAHESPVYTSTWLA